MRGDHVCPVLKFQTERSSQELKKEWDHLTPSHQYLQQSLTVTDAGGMSSLTQSASYL